MVHTLRLDNYYPTPRKLVLGTNSSFGTESIKIERGAGWDGLNLTATWHIPGREEPLRVALLDGDAMDVPPEVTKEAKDGVLVLAGLASGVQRASCNVEYLILEQAGVYGGADAEPTPELAAQVLEAALQAKADAEAAAEDAAAAKANADKAGPYAEAARAAQEAAEAAQDKAIAAQQAAENAASAAAASKSAADTLAAEAARAAQSAENFKAAANNAADLAGENATAAQQAAATATAAANDAGQSASDAAASKAAAETAAKAAQDAQTAAAEAKAEAINAQGAAQTAAKSAQDAQAAAEKARDDAKTAQQGAETARDAVAGSAEAAAKSEANAKQSADTLAESVENVVANTAAVAELKEKKAEIDDATVGANAWSSKHIIDMLCPPLEESGNPVACYPVAGYPLGVKAKWEPMQEGAGTPSPENIRPIKGLGSVTVTRCGENLLNFPQITTWTQITKTYEFKFKAGTYYLCCGNVVHGGSSAPAIAFLNAASSNVATISIEQGMKKEIKLKDCQFVILYTNGYDYYGSAGVTATVEDLMLVASNEIPSVYTPYTGQTNTLTLPETVYGGEVDAVTGDGKETWKMLTLDGTENWDWQTTNSPGKIGFTLQVPEIAIPTSPSIKGGIVCSQYPAVTANDTYQCKNGISVEADNNHYFRIYNDTYAGETVDSWKSYLAAQHEAGTPVQVCYKLAEPVPFTATGAQPIPALAGANTVLADADSVTVTGRADPIKRITDLEAAVASIN